jgi:hypothetical protein
VLAAIWLLADAAEEGAKVVIAMLITGLTFVAIILLGDWIHHASLKRRARKTRTL